MIGNIIDGRKGIRSFIALFAAMAVMIMAVAGPAFAANHPPTINTTAAVGTAL